MGKFISVIEAILVGSCVSSLLVVGTDSWKWYLSAILLIHSFEYFMGKDN